MKELEALKPCPFCGGREFTDQHDDANFPQYRCENCGARGPCIDIKPAEAAKRWNARASIEASQAQEAAEPSTPEMAMLWQELRSPLTGPQFQEHVAAILKRWPTIKEPPPASGALPPLTEAQALEIADKYGQRWKAPGEEGISFEKSHFFMFLADLLTEPAAISTQASEAQPTQPSLVDRSPQTR